ncbi:hypothetical protein SORBI_3008G142301 [Sorghum bicolor]|uniref:Uncharacterized protein n=1 Tax=Sorghum bicolor TaxID=4558 RepID=A0A1Z5R761_SORBI|nr:hypothetical protein SORBI_3008G142301 [Sorghum bicolor]
MSRASAGGAWTLCRLQRRHLSSASGSVSIFPQHIRTWKEMLQWTYPTQFLYLNATQSLLWNWVTSRSESNFSGGLNYMLGLRLSHQQVLGCSVMIPVHRSCYLPFFQVQRFM